MSVIIFTSTSVRIKDPVEIKDPETVRDVLLVMKIRSFSLLLFVLLIYLKKKTSSRVSGSFSFTSSFMKFSWGTVKSLDFFFSVNLKNKNI